MDKSSYSFYNKILITPPSFLSDNFSGNLIYIFLHNKIRSMGVFINKPIGNVIYKKNNDSISEKKIYLGGNVNLNYGIVVHSNDFCCSSSIRISNEISITPSNDLIKKTIGKKKPKQYLFLIGCTYWNREQLEEDFCKNNWLYIEASPKILFNPNDNEKWTEAIHNLGVKEPFSFKKTPRMLT